MRKNKTIRATGISFGNAVREEHNINFASLN